MKTAILEAKQKLLTLLLILNTDDLTDNEANIMFHLTNDQQIRSLLKAVKSDKEEIIQKIPSAALSIRKEMDEDMDELLENVHDTGIKACLDLWNEKYIITRK